MTDADFTKAYLRGDKAYAEGLNLSSNPYEFDTPEAQDWEDGWLAASAVVIDAG